MPGLGGDGGGDSDDGFGPCPKCGSRLEQEGSWFSARGSKLRLMPETPSLKARKPIAKYSKFLTLS